MADYSLSDIVAAYNRMPQSQNIEDRRTTDPLAIHFGDTQQPLSLAGLAYARHPMNYLPPQTGSPLAVQAGFDDVIDPDYYERRPQFSRQEAMSPEEQFRMQMMMRTLKLGGR